LDVAADILSQTLKLSAPIHIYARFGSFCATTCMDHTLGRASAASFWTLTRPDSEPTYMYPQALVKQFVDNANFADYE